MPIDFNAALTYIEGARQFLRLNKTNVQRTLVHQNTTTGTLLIRRIFNTGGDRDWFYHPYYIDLALQAKFTYVAYWAYLKTNNADWYTIATSAANAMYEYFFDSLPSGAPTFGLYMPKPFYNGTGTIWGNGLQKLGDPFTDYLAYNATFTNGVAVIPSGTPTWGNYLAEVYTVYNGELALKNRNSPVIAGTEYGVDFWVASHYRRQKTVLTYQRSKRDIIRQGADVPEELGTVQLTSNYSGPATILYTITLSDTVTLGVPSGSYGIPYKFVSRDDPDTPRNSKMEDLWWAFDAFVSASRYATTDRNKAIWKQGYISLYYTILRLSIFTQRQLRKGAVYIFKIGFNSLNRIPGVIFYSQFELSNPTWRRDAQGWAWIPHNAVDPDDWSFGKPPICVFERRQMEMLLLDDYYFQGQFWFDSITHVSNRPEYRVFFRIEIYIKNQTLPYVTTITKKKLDANKSVVALNSFIKVDEDIKWYAGVDPEGWSKRIKVASGNPLPTTSIDYALIGSINYSYYRVGFYPQINPNATAGLVYFSGLPRDTFTNPPAIYYRATIATYLRLIDQGSQTWVADLPVTSNNWVLLELTWESFYNRTTKQKATPQTPIKWIYIEQLWKSNTGYIDVAFVAVPGKKWNIDSLNTVEADDRIAERIKIICPARGSEGNYKLGDIYFSAEIEEPTTYQPGLMPFGVRSKDQEFQELIDIPPGLADQSPYHWFTWKQETRLSKMIQYLRKAQETHATTYNESGFFTPYFLWDDDNSAIHLQYGDGTPNSFSSTGHHPYQGSDLEYQLDLWVNLARIAMRSVYAKPQPPEEVIALLTQFILRIDAFYDAHPGNNAPPTNFSTTEGLITNYGNPCIAAQIGIVCIALNYRRVAANVTYNILEKVCDYIPTHYVESGGMVGSWAKNQPDIGSDENDYWGKWHVDILFFYCLLYHFRSALAIEEVEVIPGEFPYEIKIQGAVTKTLQASVVEQFEIPSSPTLTVKFPQGNTQRVKKFDYQLGGGLKLKFKALNEIEIQGFREFERVHGGLTRPFNIRDESIPLPQELILQINRISTAGKTFRPYWQLTAPLEIIPIKSASRIHMYELTIEMRQAVFLGNPLEEVT